MTTKPKAESDGKRDEDAHRARVAELEAELHKLRQAAADASAPRPRPATHRLTYACGCHEDTASPAGTQLDCTEHEGLFPVVSTMLIRKGG